MDGWTLNAHSPHLGRVLRDLQGLEFEPVEASPLDLTNIPPVIPQFKGLWYEEAAPYPYPVVAIGLDRVVNYQGRINESLAAAGSVNTWLRVPSGTRVLLVCFTGDRLLEQAWKYSLRHRLFEAIAALGFWAATSFNFSVYFDEPRMQHLVNLKRGLLTVAELARHGVGAIPNIYWAEWVDLERQLEWLDLSPSIVAVAFNMQTYKSRDLWNRALETIVRFDRAVNRPLHYFLPGAADLSRIGDVLRNVDPSRVHVVSSLPFILAGGRGYFALRPDGTVTRSHRAGMTREQAFRHNIEFALARHRDFIQPDPSGS